MFRITVLMDLEVFDMGKQEKEFDTSGKSLAHCHHRKK
jgi:hypothetical protein